MYTHPQPIRIEPRLAGHNVDMLIGTDGQNPSRTDFFYIGRLNATCLNLTRRNLQAHKTPKKVPYKLHNATSHHPYVKVKCSRYRPSVAQKVCRGIAVHFHDRVSRRGEWSAARPGWNLHPGKNRYPLHSRLGWPQARSHHPYVSWGYQLHKNTVHFSVRIMVYKLCYI